ncbi:hypothetical protein K470DRAFT_256494 [Piedraia hortae CBS 480.64]|uniref:Thioesterase/thiol ester dehydrase-isomerase n=1 Tax=Piedraia hortae CBS 480.64 TaxID=1314780 RepID=A0A6A7C377_9PEZI|nr:hypothetical protein K470DRAFT_256494 [Piedraia hortae CBS 480.64]
MAPSLDLTKTMLERIIPPVFGYMSPVPSFNLQMTLQDHIPRGHQTLPSSPTTISRTPLPPAHHMVYFEPCLPSNSLLPDGTNPAQSPGLPWKRRMWAGGRVVYNDGVQSLELTGQRAVCAEFIRNVTFRGREGGEQKVFVDVERRIANAVEAEDGIFHEEDGEGYRSILHRVRQRLWRESPDDLGPCALVETRTLVFLTEESSQGSTKEEKILRPPRQDAMWTYTITPDATLLFRFSALTNNAHAIHLDREYCRTVEGHRNLLLHGPLTYVLMMTLLEPYLHGKRIRLAEYRNLAPLYANESVTFCGAPSGREGKWDVWALNPKGGLAVKGSVIAE